MPRSCQELRDATRKGRRDGRAGASSLHGIRPGQIDGIRRFWTRWLENMGASVEFYGANLPRFPIPAS
jgi:hypothetical protein